MTPANISPYLDMIEQHWLAMLFILAALFIWNLPSAIEAFHDTGAEADDEEENEEEDDDAEPDCYCALGATLEETLNNVHKSAGVSRGRAFMAG